MKSLKKAILVIVVAMACVVPASAQFRFGLKAGAAVSSLKLNSDILSSDNRAGFTGGVMIEFTVPVLNIGMDASVLYAGRSIEVENALGEVTKDTRNYIDIPVNFKWKLGLPIVGKVISPFLTTGPDFSFLCSSQNFKGAWNRKFDVAWNVGLGLELFRHAQVAASYGFGITNSVSGDDALYKGKNRVWTVTLAYLF